MVIENMVTHSEKRGKALNVFFDTEFTRFRDMEHEPKLISIGLVADDAGNPALQDDREFYAELTDTYQQSDCSQFVLDVVLPLLDGRNRLQEAHLASQLKAWIEGLGADEVILRCDAPSYDWPFVASLFQSYGWPANLSRKCGTVYFDSDRQQRRYREGLATFWKDNQARMHHALVDARSMQFAWKHAIKRGI